MLAVVTLGAIAATDASAQEINLSGPYQCVVNCAGPGPATVTGIDQKTAMSIGGALGGPVTAFIYDWNMLPIGQRLWLQELTSYQTYPPLQAPESYNLSSIIAEVKKAEMNKPQD
jgi:hypothetical protein